MVKSPPMILSNSERESETKSSLKFCERILSFWASFDNIGQNVKSRRQGKTYQITISSYFLGESCCFNIGLILIGWRIRMNFEPICKWLQLCWTSFFIITQQAIWLAIAQPTSWNTTIVTITVIFIFATEIWKNKLWKIFLENFSKNRPEKNFRHGKNFLNDLNF